MKNLKGTAKLKAKIILISIHEIEDDRIGRHIKFLLSKNVDVYYLHYNLRQPSLQSGQFSKFGEKGFRINVLQKTNVLRKLFLIGKRIVNHSIKGLQSLKIDPKDSVILHVHNPENLKLAIKLSKQFFYNAKIIYDRHEYYEQYKGILGIKTLHRLEKSVKHEISHIVVTIHGQKISAQKIFPNADYEIVSNYPNKSDYNLNSIQKKIDSFNANSEIKFIYIGSMSPHNRDNLLMFKIVNFILEKYPQTSFRLAGKVPNEMVKNQIQELENKFLDRFKFLGFVPREEAIKLSEEAHIGFFLLIPPYTMRHSPNKIFEYLICGTVPIIRADVDHSDTLKTCSLFFNENSKEGNILESIDQLLSNPDDIKRLMVECHNLSSQYIWENEAIKYIKFYEKILT